MSNDEEEIVVTNVPKEKSQVHTILFRLHKNDYVMLKKLMTNDKFNFQLIASACIDAYMRGDPVIVDCVNDFKELNTIPQDQKKKYTLSFRERKELLDQLEETSEIEPTPKRKKK